MPCRPLRSMCSRGVWPENAGGVARASHMVAAPKRAPVCRSISRRKVNLSTCSPASRNRGRLPVLVPAQRSGARPPDPEAPCCRSQPFSGRGAAVKQAGSAARETCPSSARREHSIGAERPLSCTLPHPLRYQAVPPRPAPLLGQQHVSCAPTIISRRAPHLPEPVARPKDQV
jgi:hypothetical protein